MTCSGRRMITSSQTTPRCIRRTRTRKGQLGIPASPLPSSKGGSERIERRERVGERDSPPRRSRNEPHRRSRIRRLGSDRLPCRACFEGSRSSSANERENEGVSARTRRVFVPPSSFLPPSNSNRKEVRGDRNLDGNTYDQTTSLRINLHISRQDPNRARIERLLEVSELLVRQSFDRGGVYGSGNGRATQNETYVSSSTSEGEVRNESRARTTSKEDG